jgi:hypothetical protein
MQYDESIHAHDFSDGFNFLRHSIRHSPAPLFGERYLSRFRCQKVEILAADVFLP